MPPSRAFCTMQIERARFHDVSEGFPGGLGPFGEFIEKQQPAVSKDPSAGNGLTSAPRSEKASHPARWMRGEPRHVWPKQVMGSSSQACLSHAWRTCHQHGQPILGGDAEPFLGNTLSFQTTPSFLWGGVGS